MFQIYTNERKVKKNKKPKLIKGNRENSIEISEVNDGSSICSNLFYHSINTSKYVIYDWFKNFQLRYILY